MFELEPGPPPGGGLFRKQISAGWPNQVPDFTLAVRTASDPELIANAHSDGRDIYFATDAGISIPHELVAYADGNLEAWVRVELPSDFYMYYGGDAIADEPALVWQGFHAVWHVDDVTVGRDSTGSFNLTEVPDPPVAVAGIIGRGAELEETGEDIGSAMCAPSSQTLTLSSFSYSLWVKQGQQVGQFDQPFDTGGNSSTIGGFGIEIATTDWKAVISDADNNSNSQVPIGASTNDWQHLAVSIERGAPSVMRTYLDGSLGEEVVTTEEDITTTVPICLGGRSRFSGQVDEVRIHEGALDRDWYAAEFATAKPAYLSFGLQEPLF